MNKRQWAWVLVDVGNSAFATTILAAVFPVYFPAILPTEGIHINLGFFSWTTHALSLWAYTVSGSVFLTFLISPFLGAWADESGRRKSVFGFFSFLGIGGTLLLSFTQTWYLALGAFVIGNIGFAASNVFYNSLLCRVAEEKDFDRLSLNGYAWGYIGGGLVLTLNLFMIMRYESFGLSSRQAGLQLSFASVSLWWLIFTIPALLSIPEAEKSMARNLSSEAKKRIEQIWQTIKTLPKIPSLLIFVISYAFFNEGIQIRSTEKKR